MKRELRIALFFLMLLRVTSCAKPQKTVSSDIENQFQDILPVSDMNKSLKLEVYDGENKFPTGSQIHLRLYNQSPYAIVFQTKSHIRLLTFQGQKWTEVENGNTYSGELRLAPKGTALLDSTTTWVQPVLDHKILEENKTGLVLRIVVIGEITENDASIEKSLGAYVDIQVTE